MAAASGPRPLRPGGPGRPTEDGLRGAHRRLDARAIARLGGDAAVAVAACRRRPVAAGAGAAGVARAPGGHAQLAVPAVDRPDAAGLAGTVGLVPRRV